MLGCFLVCQSLWGGENVALGISTVIILPMITCIEIYLFVFGFLYCFVARTWGSGLLGILFVGSVDVFQGGGKLRFSQMVILDGEKDFLSLLKLLNLINYFNLVDEGISFFPQNSLLLKTTAKDRNG